jgi:peptide-methionine (R)-S-oxide reductase
VTGLAALQRHIEPMDLKRRHLLLASAGLLASLASRPALAGDSDFASSPLRRLTDAQWRQRLGPEAYRVLRKADTERPGTSPLNREKRKGVYVCAGCNLPLFKSDWKYESGTGWPSFFKAIEKNVGRKQDFSLLIPRTEYHCARCLGHQGHLFADGPRPTGFRWCNNGAALKFLPA